MESTGDMDTALQYYEKAKDILSLVRVYCYCGELIKVSGGWIRVELLHYLSLNDMTGICAGQ